MKHLTVRHATTYRYDAPVTFGQHRLMLRPRDSHDLRLVGAELSISPHGTLRWMHDVFGNSVAVIDFAEPAAELIEPMVAHSADWFVPLPTVEPVALLGEKL